MNSTGQIKHQAIMAEASSTQLCCPNTNGRPKVSNCQQQQRLHQTSMDNRITRTNRSATHDQLPNKGSRMSEITVARYEAFEKGAAFEQERIIKLLEEQRIELAAQGGITEAITMGLAIALIKGENK